MKYKRKNGSKYSHLVTEQKMILGIDKDWDMETATALLNKNPINIYEPEMLQNIMSLSLADREILIDSIDEYVRLHRCKEFNNIYWDIIIDFIFVLYGYTLYDIAVVLEETYKEQKKPYEEKYSSKYFYDILDKLRTNKGKIRKSTQEYVKLVCDYFRITDEILTTGSGYIYLIQNTKEYSASEIRECRIDNCDALLKDILHKITGIQKKDIIEIPLEISIIDNIIEDNVKEYIDIIIRKMRESRL